MIAESTIRAEQNHHLHPNRRCGQHAAVVGSLEQFRSVAVPHVSQNTLAGSLERWILADGFINEPGVIRVLEHHADDELQAIDPPDPCATCSRLELSLPVMCSVDHLNGGGADAAIPRTDLIGGNCDVSLLVATPI